jgi:hypothetical protein
VTSRSRWRSIGAAFTCAIVAAWFLLPGEERLAMRLKGIGLGARAVDSVLAFGSDYQPLDKHSSCSPDGAVSFLCGDPADPYLARIRRDPRLAPLLELPPNRLQTWAAFQDFLRGRFAHGEETMGTEPFGPGFHLLEMLDDADRGGRFLCGAASKMLIQLVRAAGGYGRMLSIWDPRGSGHVVTELWVEEPDQPGRWVVFDPDYDVYFTDASGIPLSALDLHRLHHQGRANEAVAVAGASPNRVYRPELHEYLVSHYADVLYQTRANWTETEFSTWDPRRTLALDAWMLESPDSWFPREAVRGIVNDPTLLYFRPQDPPAPPAQP